MNEPYTLEDYDRYLACLSFARDFVRATRPHEPIIGWNIRRAFPGDQPKNPNTWGAVLRALIREGALVRNTDKPYVKHPSPEWHGREVKCWVKKLDG